MTPTMRWILGYCKDCADFGKTPDIYGQAKLKPLRGSTALMMVIVSMRERGWLDGEFRITKKGSEALADDNDGRLLETRE
jgi:hypothetical protein